MPSWLADRQPSGGPAGSCSGSSIAACRICGQGPHPYRPLLNDVHLIRQVVHAPQQLPRAQRHRRHVALHGGGGTARVQAAAHRQLHAAREGGRVGHQGHRRVQQGAAMHAVLGAAGLHQQSTPPHSHTLHTTHLQPPPPHPHTRIHTHTPFPPTFSRWDRSISPSGSSAEGGWHRPCRTATSSSWSSQYLKGRGRQQRVGSRGRAGSPHSPVLCPAARHAMP